MPPSCQQGMGVGSLCYSPVLFGCGLALCGFCLWVPGPALLLLMYVLGMGGAGQSDCCQMFCHLPLLLLRANCPGFSMGPPYPLLRSPPPPPIPSAGSLPLPPLGIMGIVGAVALSGHLCLRPRPAAIPPLPQPLHVLSELASP